jgi:hypothetical protein
MAWLEHPVVREILNRLIDYTDAIPTSERSRAVGFRATADTVPALFSPAAPGDDDYIWGLIEKLKEHGWIDIRLAKARPGIPSWERNPYITLVADSERAVRAVLGREERKVSEHERWRAALEAVKHRFPGSIERLGSQPLRVPGKTPEQVVERLSGTLDLARGESLYLREASARLFWGLSKLLDNRGEAIAALLGVPICPFPEKPVLLHVRLPPSPPDGVLFIENETVFASACERPSPVTQSLLLVYAAGFKTAAKRMRLPGGAASYFYGQRYNDDWIPTYMAWLRGEVHLPVHFWGDLDYSGMAILKALRDGFPQMTAWQLGYQSLVDHLQQGEGHSPEAADKEGQIDPVKTGCGYADLVLLPEIRASGLFLDQEYVIREVLLEV